MKTNELISVDNWFEFTPHDGHYADFNPNIVATGFKINEVYSTILNARLLLVLSESKDDLGEFSTEANEAGKTLLASTFLQSALASYNYCIDLSWQVAWFYCAPDDAYDLIDNEKVYIDYCKQCTFEALSLKLKLGRRFEVFRHLNDFLSSEITVRVRSEYNYIKHRGAYYTPGVGEQRPYMFGSVNGERLKVLTKNIFDVNEWLDRLINFDNLFKQYFDTLINYMMPMNFKESEVTFSTAYNYYHKKKDAE